MPTRLLLASSLAMLLSIVALMQAQIETQAPERWWRGNLHTHTLWSDGDDFPEMVADWYRGHGYHFLALSDHNTLLMIQAEELTGSSGDGHSLHFNVTNLAEQLTMRMGGTVSDTIVRNLQMVEESARRTGRLSIMHVNHPNYQWGVTAEDLAAAVNERFFEVWNGVDNDNDNGDATRASTDAIWDIANTLRIVRYNASPLYGLATDDTHDHHGNKSRALPGRAWVMVRARHLTPESMLRALRTGNFYSSSGVVLESVAYEKSKLSIEIQPSGSETFVTRFIGTRKGVKLNGRPRGDGDAITTLDYGDAKIGEVLAEVRGLNPTYTMRGDELYVRAIVTSSGAPEVPSEEFAYKRAWVQPVR